MIRKSLYGSKEDNTTSIKRKILIEEFEYFGYFIFSVILKENKFQMGSRIKYTLIKNPEGGRR